MSFKRARTMSFSQGYGSQLTNGSGLSRTRATKSLFRASKGGRARSTKGKLTAARVRSIVKRELLSHQEVKYLDDSAVNQTVAQVNLDATGHNTIGVNITPAQGTGASKRIGDSILADQLTVNMNMWGQTQFGSACNLTTYLVAFRGPSPSPVIAEFLDGNLAIEDLNVGAVIYDVNSLRQPDYLENVQVIGMFKNHIPADLALSAPQTSYPHTSSQKIFDLKGLKIEYDQTSGFLSNVALALITVADSGNRNASASTLLGLPTNTALTGVLFNVTTRLTYRDA